MKVQGLSDLIRSMQRVNGRGSEGGGSQGGRHSPKGDSDSSRNQGGHSDSSEENRTEFQRLLELRQKIDLEIERFARDEVALKSGIHARRDGEGPGLRVFFEDGKGKVVRRMSGDEFLQIRTTDVSPTTSVRGKLLDRKL